MSHSQNVLRAGQRCPLRAGQRLLALLVVVAHFYVASAAFAFVPEGRWTSTSLGSTGVIGDSISLSWSIVPDGTPIPGKNPSSLISFLDTNFGLGPGGSDLKLRPWFPLIDESFGRWSELGGITFRYEPHDDGVAHASASGSLNVRGDIRLAGANEDGPGGTLAYSYYPNNSDMGIDTSDAAFLGQAAFDYRRFRNTIMHELGHGIGLAHLASNTDAFLMEPAISASFDGPQLDDIRGLHHFYGDVYEKSHNRLGNDTIARAVSLGTIAPGSILSIGTSAGPDTVVAKSDVDFVSISNSFDIDYFSFSVLEPVRLNVTLTPRGGVYNQGIPGGEQTSINANASSDLALAVLGANGTTQLGFVNDAPAGGVESLANIDLVLPGEYFIRVNGSTDVVQLYELQLGLVAAVTLLTGDYNQDGVVDAADYTVWRESLGQTGSGLIADANGDNVVNQLDYNLWKSNFGNSLGSASSLGNSAIASQIPEPTSALMGVLACLLTSAFCRRNGRRASGPKMRSAIAASPFAR